MGSAKQIKFRQAVAKMVNERYITAVRPVDTVTKVDRVMAEERKEIEKLMVPPTAKELKEIRARIKEREDEEYHNTAVIGIKRKAVNYEDSTMEIGGDSGLVKEELAIDAVDEDMFFRAYTDRLDVFLRNQQITNYFADKYNAAAGAVVKTMLRLTEPKTKTCRDKVSTTVSASQVMQNLAHDAPLADSVDLDNDAYFDSLESAKSDGAQAMTRKERAEIVLALLEVVSSDRSGMVRKLEERGAGQFVVDFSNAATALRDQCIDALVHEKFGSLHARTVRILRDKQKLDEKVIAQAVMLPIAQCREKLHDLALEGIIDTLEIPRTADRNPSRMFYLWFINSEKQVRNALRMAFEGIANAMARLDYEVTARDTLTAKANRDDVIANPDLLTEGERDELAKLEATALRLQVACVRLDRMLLVLHDINPSSAELNLL
ncbi:RNA polymerase III subunit C82 [Linderina macrospora]|uniref:RNA polymerase III subunit C82 n=1 Tax=Linderina macrospora TaxID=4868 RepID=A0ACC1JGS7_9FUNG|nr:RNA polymerase III subunit C82 [Linderina macrospora]